MDTNLNTDSGYTLIIEKGRSETNYWKDLWRYRELFYILAWRDVSVRYKQTVVGIAWSVIQPLLTMLIFTFIFGSIAQLPSEGAAPYAIMVFVALLPWQFFANSLAFSSQSMTTNANLISKVYFPRMIVPFSSVITSFIDFLISFVILCALMVYFQYLPSYRIFLLPLFVLFAFVAAMGIGLFITALNVKYRDFKIIVPFIVQFGLYVSPVGFSSSIIPEQYQLLYSLNPMVGVIDGFRWSILGGESSIYWPGFLTSLGISLLLLILGIRFFRKTERVFADIV